MIEIISNLKPDIVVIGGGPIGLWTAIQTRLLSGKEIVVLEKNSEYKRRDIHLNIHAYSLSGIPHDPQLTELTKRWAEKAVPIQEMENALANRANELGIKILAGERIPTKQLPSLFPTAKLFIGADGAKSEVRKEIFDDQFRFKSTLQYIAQVQYIVNKNPTSLGTLKDFSVSYQMQKFANHLIIQNVHPLADGSARVTLQIFIDQETYDQMQEATFKNPYYFESDLDKLPQSLHKVLIKWWGARQTFYEELISSDIDSKNKITVIALNSYAAKDVAKMHEGRVWTLVGDAAAGFPFFRSINNGLLLGTKLAHRISIGMKRNDEKELMVSLKHYSRYVCLRAFIERIRAFFKNLFLNISKLWIKISSRMPWQTIKLSPGQKKHISEIGTQILSQLSSKDLPKKAA